MHARIMREVILPTVSGMTADGIPFTGFLYAGVMIDAAGTPRVLEFNCRMGDPETQPIMARLKTDFVDLLEHAIGGTLDTIDAEWDRRTALGVVLAAAGYPDAPRKGDAIAGLDRVTPETHPDVQVFHAGTATRDGSTVVNGGRVLCVTALGDSVRQAQRAAYAAVGEIQFAGMQFRTDIGHRAIKGGARVAAPETGA
jgi:phosphoribosylamine---glycine ligase